MKTLTTLLIALFIGCSGTQYISQRTEQNVEFGYKWNHPVSGAPELLVRIANSNATSAHVEADIDLFYQGLRVETFLVDTCINPSHTMQGKLNGIYFISSKVTNEQVKSGDAEIALTKYIVTPNEGTDCP